MARYGLADEGPGRADDRRSFPAQSSVLDENALLHRVVPLYAVESPTACRFLTRGDADVYRITAGEQAYYLKVYRPPRRLARAEAEGRFVSALASGGLSVVRPVPSRTGTYAHEVKASEGRRPLLLFEEAPPPLSRPPSTALLRKIGQAVARLHAVADGLSESYELPVINDQRGEELLPHVREFVTERDFRFLEELTESLHRRLGALPSHAPDHGWCHADLVLSNIRLTSVNEVVFFDFGNAARLHRLFELTTVWRSLGREPEDARAASWHAFLEGYQTARELPERFEAYLPLAQITAEIRFLAANAASLPLRLGTAPLEGDFMARGLDRIRRLVDSCPDA